VRNAGRRSQGPPGREAPSASFQLDLPGVGELVYQLQETPDGLLCSRTLRRGPHEVTRMIAVFRSFSELEEFIGHDEYLSGNERFFTRIRVAGRRIVR
jgi:hypothetical protein